MSSRGIGGWIWSVSFSLWTLSTVYLCDWVNTSWAVCSDQPGVLQWFHLLIWICILFVPIWSQYTVPHSDPSLVSILFEHIILKLMCFLWNSGHFSSHFRTFLVEFCRDRRLRAFPKILKILASSLFSLPCLTIFLTLFEPNSEWHPWVGPNQHPRGQQHQFPRCLWRAVQGALNWKFYCVCFNICPSGEGEVTQTTNILNVEALLPEYRDYITHAMHVGGSNSYLCNAKMYCPIV